MIRYRVGGWRGTNAAAAAAQYRGTGHNCSHRRCRYRRCCPYRSCTYYCYTPSSPYTASSCTTTPSCSSRNGFMRGQRRTARERGSQRDRLSNYWTLWMKEETDK